MDELGERVEPDEHDRRVFELVSDVLGGIRALHYQLLEQTVVVLEIAERRAPADQLAALREQVDVAADEVHYQAVDGLWELERERIGKPRRFHRQSTL